MTHYQCALCEGLQEQLFRSIYKPFLYVLYNIKYLLVISNSEGYPLSLIVHFSMSSAYYALVLGDRLFPNLLFCQILLFGFYLRKYAIIWLLTLKKVRLQNLQLIFLVILRIFVLECHGQTSVKVELVMFALVFKKFRKLRSLCRENKKLNLRKTLIFSLFKSFPILLASSIGQKLFSKN